MKSPKISSNFAILDVKVGRGRLGKIVGEHKHRVPVTITGFIADTHSGDDGVSVEFSVDVAAVKLGDPVEHDCTCIRCLNHEPPQRPPCPKCFNVSEVIIGTPKRPRLALCGCGEMAVPVGTRGEAHARAVASVRAQCKAA